MGDVPETPDPHERLGCANRLTIPATCSTHRGGRPAVLIADERAGFSAYITDEAGSDPTGVTLAGAVPEDEDEPLAAGVSHLLVAESDLLDECHRHRRYLTICGQVVAVSELPTSWCEPGCEREHAYCPDCVREALRRSGDVVD